MIIPVLQDAEFIADVHAAAADSEHLHLWWLGQSGFLVQFESRHLLLDPYLSDSLTRKYAATDKPHVRMTERIVNPERLDFIDIVTSSHNHTDHLDAETLRPIIQANPGIELVIPEANREFVADRLRTVMEFPRGLDAGQFVRRHGFTIHAVPAAHELIDQDDAGRHRYLGYVVQCGPWTIYHSGDTVLYDSMVDRLRAWPIDVALLPINGRSPERRVAGNLFGAEAAQLAHAIGARLVIPCHYDMFEFNTASPEELAQACRSLNQPYTVLACGERWTSRNLERR
jgi:L-ascorbate metabolism protein UlaG (beta-lactamase superfamily)